MVSAQAKFSKSGLHQILSLNLLTLICTNDMTPGLVSAEVPRIGLKLELRSSLKAGSVIVAVGSVVSKSILAELVPTINVFWKLPATSEARATIK